MANIVKKNGETVKSDEKAAEKVAYSKHKPQKTNALAGENEKYLAHNMAVAYMEKIDPHNAEEVKQRTIDYFLLCQENDMKPSVAGYALALGVTRHTLKTWLNGKVKTSNEVKEVLEKAYAVLNALMESWMQDGKIYPVAAIFLAKNSFGYKDISDVVITPNKAETDPQSLIDAAKLLPD